MAIGRMSPWNFLWVSFGSLFLAIGFASIYGYISREFNLLPWNAVIAAHAFIALMLFMLRKPTRDGLRLKGCPIIAWLPGFAVLCGAWLLTRVGGYSPQGLSLKLSHESLYMLATLSVIPFLEEIVFRCGVSPMISRVVGSWWGVWFAAITFSLVHTNPTWSRVVALKVGLPLGPFLLAICSDVIIRKWGRVMPAVFFHACCNGTVYIFSSLNPSWLGRLQGLYV